MPEQSTGVANMNNRQHVPIAATSPRPFVVSRSMVEGVADAQVVAMLGNGSADMVSLEIARERTALHVASGTRLLHAIESEIRTTQTRRVIRAPRLVASSPKA